MTSSPPDAPDAGGPGALVISGASMPYKRLWVQTEEMLAGLTDHETLPSRIAIDVESNGMHAYRPRVCTVQLAWQTSNGPLVAIIDTIALSPSLLSPLFQNPGIIKVVHDLAFDARILHKEGVSLCNVHDTSVAAAYLGRTSRGLASLLDSELGITITKELQTSDWSQRPLSPHALDYLATDVEHLLLLDEKLQTEAASLGIASEIDEETRYRLDSAHHPTEERPAFVRIKGSEVLDSAGMAVLKELSDVREHNAQVRDVPPYRVAPDYLLVQLARRRPMTEEDLRRLSAKNASLVAPIVSALLEGIRKGAIQGRLDPTDEAWFKRELPPKNLSSMKRIERELIAWRKKEALRRQVHEQVVLPGHCIRTIASQCLASPTDIATLPGLGQARADRYAELVAGLVQKALEPYRVGVVD